MRFSFDEDQLLFQDSLREFLANECTPDAIRAGWEQGRSHSPELWAQLAELGVTGLLVPEAHEGLGMSEVASVLLFEEAGRAALPEPVVSTVAVAAPLLADLAEGELAGAWLPRIGSGDAIVAVGHEVSPLVVDADLAHLFLLQRGDAVHAVAPDDCTAVEQPANDPSRRLFAVDFSPSETTCVADGEAGRALWNAALDRGALACAAQLLGVTDKLITLASEYAEQRHQFGKPIGSFQAVKHMLADCKVKLEYARPLVHRAAHSVAHGVLDRALHVSMAKVAAADAAGFTAGRALQVHGAIGYTWEQDLHIWMRRAWSFEQAWGRNDFHRRRVEAAILSDGARLGPGETFRGG
ncbi:MAG: acyl-CoA dehydrogenase family protein [Myxococcota bacterium]|nr:acyl-CoA dehydrogenase family protein [Myxococcota bacterium]